MGVDECIVNAFALCFGFGCGFGGVWGWGFGGGDDLLADGGDGCGWDGSVEEDVGE